jgi:hypothetical protein
MCSENPFHCEERSNLLKLIASFLAITDCSEKPDPLFSAGHAQMSSIKLVF